MNIIEFMQTGGFPLETDTLNAMQNDYRIFNNIGGIIGDKTIVSGCVTVGNTVTDGIIFINNEFIKLVGGITQNTIIIRETTETKEFQNGSVKVVFKTRFAEFGTGINTLNWADFNRPLDLATITNRLISLEKKSSVFQANGAMVFWNKPASEIPNGWQEVVDWRGRLPVGVDANQIEFETLGLEGGEKTVTLTEAQMPIHTHIGTAVNSGDHHHTLFFNEFATGANGGPGYDGGSNQYQSNVNKTTTNAGAHSHPLNINNAGGNTSHNNLPPYRTVYFIEYIG